MSRFALAERQASTASVPERSAARRRSSCCSVGQKLPVRRGFRTSSTGLLGRLAVAGRALGGKSPAVDVRLEDAEVLRPRGLLEDAVVRRVQTPLEHDGRNDVLLEAGLAGARVPVDAHTHLERRREATGTEE